MTDAYFVVILSLLLTSVQRMLPSRKAKIMALLVACGVAVLVGAF